MITDHFSHLIAFYPNQIIEQHIIYAKGRGEGALNRGQRVSTDEKEIGKCSVLAWHIKHGRQIIARHIRLLRLLDYLLDLIVRSLI